MEPAYPACILSEITITDFIGRRLSQPKISCVILLHSVYRVTARAAYEWTLPGAEFEDLVRGENEREQKT